MSKKGLLVVAHGSSNPAWVEWVDLAVKNVRFEGPIEVGYLEMVKERTIALAIQSLEEKGIEEIVVIPLFISSGSTHIEEIKALLGVTTEPLVPIHQDPIPIQASIRFASAMDDHPTIVELLYERVKELSQKPQDEVILLVGHGSDVAGFQEVWEKGLQQAAKRLQVKEGFAGASFATTIFPHQLRERVEEWNQQYSVLIVPLFLSEGYFTKKVIPSRLEGLSNVRYTGRAFLPSPRISSWIESVAAQFFQSQTI